MATAKNYSRIVRQVQQKTRKNQAELARLFRVSQPTISRWLSGSDPELHHSNTIEDVARGLGILNSGSNIEQSTVPIVGYVGAGGTIAFSDGQGPFGEAEMPPVEGVAELVAVTVRGDSMSGMLEDGWTLYYDRRRVPPDESFFNRLCVVGLDDGRILVKKLYPGRKPRHFDLHSTNAPPLLDQAVEWAAKVAWIAVK
jgi:phage repressor protein C with HTH and peptisase S24 domain